MNELASELAMSSRNLSRVLKAETGMSPLQFINEIRLQEARQLLELGRYSVSEAMYKVGYKSGGHFSNIFKSRFGKTPSQYLKSEFNS